VDVLFRNTLYTKGKGKVHSCTGTEALYRPYRGHRGSRGTALLFHDHGTRRGWGVSVTPRPLSTPGKELVPIVQEAGWAPESVWTGAENLAPTGIRFPDRPARSQSLYRLSYPAHPVYKVYLKCLDKVQEWVSHIKTQKILNVKICPKMSVFELNWKMTFFCGAATQRGS
jgi:hypothetical protein